MRIRAGGWHTAAIRTGLRHKWPVAAAAIPPAFAALVFGWIPNFSPSDGIWFAFIIAVTEQQLFGLAAVRHARLTGAPLAAPAPRCCPSLLLTSRISQRVHRNGETSLARRPAWARR